MWLRNRGWGTKSISYFPPFVPAQQFGGAQRFNLRSIAGVGAGWVQDDVTDAGGLIIPLMHMPAKGEMSLIRVYLACDSSGAPHTLMPATKPIVRLIWEVPTLKQSAVLFKQATDPSTLVANYEALHYIELVLTGGDLIEWSQEEDSGHPRIFYISFTGETGANSVASSLMFKGYSQDFLAL